MPDSSHNYNLDDPNPPPVSKDYKTSPESKRIILADEGYERGEITPENRYGSAPSDHVASKYPIKTRCSTKQKIPFAYEALHRNSRILIPHWAIIIKLEEAMDFISHGHSFRECSDWLNNVLPKLTKLPDESHKRKTITHQGLRNYWQADPDHGSNPKNDRRKELRKASRQRKKGLTAAEKREQELRRKRANAKRTITASENRLRKLKERNEQKQEEEQRKAEEAEQKRILDLVRESLSASEDDPQSANHHHPQQSAYKSYTYDDARKDASTKYRKSLVGAGDIDPQLIEQYYQINKLERDLAHQGFNVLIKPNPGPQTDFLAATERELLFGGAAGGGKTMALIMDPMRYFHNSNFNGLILRRTTDELREIVWKTQELYPQLFPGAKWQEKKSQWVFPSGARLWLTYLERDEDVLRYQGQAFAYIAFDELCQYATPFAWNYMRSRLRTTDSTLPLCMRACVDEGEVLTTAGWKDIRDIEEGENVYSILKNGDMVIRKVTGTHVFDVDEPLIRVRKKNLYMSMTPDHRVAYQRYGSKNIDLVRFNEHEGRCISVLRTSLSYSAPGYKSPIASFSDNEYAEFLGLYIAEGCTIKPHKGNYKVIITQNKTENHQWVRQVMEASGLNVCYSKNGDFQITNKALHTHLEPLGKAHQKHFPREFLDNASQEQLRIAFDAYAKGDGHWQSEKSCTLVTCSKLLADNLQEIAIKMGYRTQVSRTILDNPSHNDRYTVYVTLRCPSTKVDKNPVGRNDVVYEPYKGKVYCISVDETENFILRQKGSVWVSGNTTNPGGPGHTWVKKGFIDPAPPNTTFGAVDFETGEPLVYPKGHPKEGEALYTRKFIPATLYDNPYLMADGQYEANLLSLPYHQRKALLDGEWNITEGAAFPEFSLKYHTCDPFDVPSSWTRFAAADYGYASPSACYWFAIDPAFGTLYVYRELYEAGLTGRDFAQKVKDTEEEEDDKVYYRVLDSSVWHKRGQTGPSIAEEMLQVCRWRPSDRTSGSRIARKNRLHELLKVDESLELPGIVFFNTCRQIIADLQVIPVDPKGTEDIDPRYKNDHSYDAIGYGIMSRPKPRQDHLWGADKALQVHKAADAVFGY